MARKKRKNGRLPTPNHDGQGLNPCSPSCKGCKAETAELARLGPPPPPDLTQAPRGPQTHAHKGQVTPRLRKLLDGL